MTRTDIPAHVEPDRDRLCVAPDRSTVYRCRPHGRRRDPNTSHTTTTGDNQ